MWRVQLLHADILQLAVSGFTRVLLQKGLILEVATMTPNGEFQSFLRVLQDKN